MWGYFGINDYSPNFVKLKLKTMIIIGFIAQAVPTLLILIVGYKMTMRSLKN